MLLSGVANPRRLGRVLSGILSTMLFFSGAPLFSQNLFTNPGFEDGTTGWAGPLANSTAAMFGTNCVLAAFGPFGTVSQSLLGVMTPNRTYTFSSWFRAPSGTGTLTLMLNQADNGGSRSTTITN